jgi:hypothetical protein
MTRAGEPTTDDYLVWRHVLRHDGRRRRRTPPRRRTVYRLAVAKT